MARRRSTAPRSFVSSVEPSAFDASPFTSSIYPHIDAFTDNGQIVIGNLASVGPVAIATDGKQTVAMLRRRKDESFKQLLGRLDTAIGMARIDGVYVDEVNLQKS